MTLHTDVPTRGEIEALSDVRGPACVSLYLPTSPRSQEAMADRIAFKNQVAQAADLLREAGVAEADVRAIEEPLAELEDDLGFWAHQARSLATFATPARVVTYRLPNDLAAAVHVADRFHVKPLLRSTSFPQAAFVLALAQGSVRLVEVAPDAPASTVPVPDLPTDVASSVRRASVADRAPRGRVQGAEGQKVRMRQYARAVDRALRAVLAGRDLPLVLAATAPIDAIYRSVNTYPQLAERGIDGNPETLSDAELAQAAREVLDALYAAELEELRRRFEAWRGAGRASTDLTAVARAASLGAVDTLLVDIDVHVPGTIDDAGATTFTDDARAAYGVTDEIARRTLRSGGRVVAVRADDLPDPSPVAALLRYPV